MKTYVVDASFILGALLEDTESIKLVFGKIFDEVMFKKATIYSSQLLPFEVANVCRYKFKDGDLGMDLYDKFCQLPICFLTLDANQIKQALSLAYAVKSSVYDAGYHLAAQIVGGTYLTCDRQYYLKAKKTGNIQLI